jgi:hypothetical protein
MTKATISNAAIGLNIRARTLILAIFRRNILHLLARFVSVDARTELSGFTLTDL